MNIVLFVCIAAAAIPCFCMFWFAVMKIEGEKQRVRLETDRLRASLITDMLDRKMTTEEIERVLVAWNGKRRWIRSLLKTHVAHSAKEPLLPRHAESADTGNDAKPSSQAS